MSDCLALFGVIRALPIRTGFGKVDKQLQLILSLSVWVPADVDFVACFQSNCWFFRQNRCTSRIVLCGNAISKLSATMTTTKRRKIKLKA